MTSPDQFAITARNQYETANRDMLHWLLKRKKADSAFVDTKQSSTTLEDFADDDGLKGRPFTYGWIQGRGLEALVTHADYFQARDPALAQALNSWARDLYHELDKLWDRYDCAHFCYDAEFAPVCTTPEKAGQRQQRDKGYSTYADTFVAKGLIAAAARFFPDDLPRHLAKLSAIIEAIETGRFVMAEGGDIDANLAASQPDDFGPRMILLTAASMVRQLGLNEHGTFASRFIDHVIEHHYHPDSGLVSMVPGGSTCNIGHTIEFAGFAYEALGEALPDALNEPLQKIITATFAAGFREPGLRLTIDMTTGKATSPYCPWWSLPETIRAASLCYQRTSSPEVLATWRQAHEAFFTHYWRSQPPIAYQNMTDDGPVDVILGTPDLDAGYHTGMSFLTAIDAIDRTTSQSA